MKVYRAWIETSYDDLPDLYDWLVKHLPDWRHYHTRPDLYDRCEKAHLSRIHKSLNNAANMPHIQRAAACYLAISTFDKKGLMLAKLTWDVDLISPETINKAMIVYG